MDVLSMHSDFSELVTDYLDMQARFKTLKYQYGIASNTIHELRGANALLRERVRELEAKVLDA